MADHCGTFEAARLLGLSVGTVQSLVEQGALQAWKTPGGHRRIDRASIEQFQLRKGKAAPAPAAAGAPASAPTPLRVLVIEDDPADLATLQAAIQSWQLPLECSYMHSGVRALIDIATLRPQVLLTGLQLPGVDGFELIATLDRDPAFNALLMLAMTRPGEDDTRTRDRLPPHVQVLAKPLNLAWLQGFFCALLVQHSRTAH